MPQNIVIYPQSGVPQIQFCSSGNTTPINLNVYSNYQSATGSGSAVLFEGSQGQLFGITDNLSSGTIFSVSDITGLPLFQIDASGDVRIGEYARYVGVGTGVPQYQLDVYGTGNFRGVLSIGGDVFFNREASNIASLRNGTTAQTFRISNTYTSTGNYEAAQLSFVNNEFRIGTIEAGPGAQRATVFGQWSQQPTGTFTHVMSIAPSAICVQVGVQDTTYYRCRFMVTTDNTSTTFGSSSIADQGIYIGNSTNTINRPVGVQFGGQPGWAFGGVYGIMTNTGGNTYGDVAITTRLSSNAGGLSPVARWYGSTGKVLFSGGFENQGMGNTTDTQYTFLVPNHINQVSGTESPDFLLSLGSKTWASGNIGVQRFVRITTPTVNIGATGIITSGITLSIAGPPTRGSGVSIINSYALVIESGQSCFGGSVKIGAYTLPTGDGTAGQTLTTNGTGVVTWSSAGGGISSINGLSGSSQTLSVATTGSDFTISSSSTTHRFNLPDASSSARGLVATADQTFAGIKKMAAGRIDFDDVAGPPEIPASGGVLYVQAGALKYLSAGGTTTTIAPN